LTPAEAAEWRAIVDRLPATWFPRETHPLLVQFCRHVCQARRLATMIKAAELAEPFDAKEFGALLSAEARQSAVIASLAGKMRLTPSSRLRAENAAVAAAKPGAALLNLWDRAD
jgi:hypothetical protein